MCECDFYIIRLLFIDFSIAFFLFSHFFIFASTLREKGIFTPFHVS